MKTIQDLEQALQTLGMKVTNLPERTSGLDTINIIIGRCDGVKIAILIQMAHSGPNYIRVDLWERSAKGGMKNVDYRCFPSIDACLAWILACVFNPAPKPPPLPPEVPEHKFATGDSIVIAPLGKGYTIRRVPAQIMVIFETTIVHLDGRKLVPDIYNPEHDNLWFHFSCANYMGATFDILSDGSVFIPVNRYTKDSVGRLSVTTTMTPKESVNLNLMNDLDKELINFAIQKFMS